MNIYKFRGKRRKNGEWAVGLLQVNNEKSAAIYSDELDRICRVDPETVGLWLMNRNGQDIWQGDILEYIDPDGKKQIGVIGFGEYDNNGSGLHIGFHVKWADNFVNSWMRHDVKFWFTCREVRIVGNVHDNPELLEVPHV